MKALVAHEYGPASQLTVEEVPDPEPGLGQVLIAIEAAALNPLDLRLVTGAARDFQELEFPYIPGMDGAGTIAAVGPGVSRFVGGEEVFGFFGATPGTIAELALIDDGPYLAARPGELHAVRAAAIPESALTATSLLRAAGLQAGSTALVIGATGGIGMFLVQLAARDGAAVLATAGPEDSEYVRGLGATAALDYRSTDIIEETLRLYPDGVHAVFDLVNMGPALADSVRPLRPGGRLISPTGGPDAAGLGREDITVVYTGLNAHRDPGDLDQLGARVAAEVLAVEIGGVYMLENARQAFVDFADTHTRGKLVVTP
jgi:NADPH:quinone reductase-like Zn-dependent oxidoreductase